MNRTSAEVLRSQIWLLGMLWCAPQCFFLWPCQYQNEEVLKKCSQEYLSRVKKEEQRYQALKVHAEEKLDR